jgi:class 3 adenylate cyclase
MAASGEILVSGAVAEAVDAAVAPRASLGRHQLAGLPQAFEVFRLLPPA